MPSEKLNTLIALRRANAYRPDQSIEELRGPGPDGGRIHRAGTKVESCDANGVYGEWVTCGSPAFESVLLFFHGGGYYRSSAKASRRIASDLSQACGCRVFTADYRLAPEHHFPAAIDDAYAVYQWLQEQGLAPNQIIVSGSSAGGGLAAALMVKLKQLGEPQPTAAVLLSPWTDLTQSAATFETNAESDPTISKAYLDRMAAQYLDGADPKQPLASPVFSGLDGLPSLLIQVGKSETMYGDAKAFAEKAKASGVPVTFEGYEDAPHGWHNSAHVIPDIPETLEAIDRIGSFFKAHVYN